MYFHQRPAEDWGRGLEVVGSSSIFMKPDMLNIVSLFLSELKGCLAPNLLDPLVARDSPLETQTWLCSEARARRGWEAGVLDGRISAVAPCQPRRRGWRK